MIDRRSFLAASLAGVGLAATLAGCDSDSSKGADGDDGKDALPINLGYIADGNGATLVAVAEKLDLWKKHGLDPKISVFTNGPIQIQALGTGDIDFGYIGPGALWLAMEGKASVVSLNSLGEADRLIAQPGLDSIEKLKGKKVGVVEGTSSDMILALALENANMTDKDIERVAMDPPTAISAFVSGQIDAAAIWYPHVETIRSKVPDLVEMDIAKDFPELQFPASQVAGAKVAEEKKEELKRFQAAAKEAFTWASDNFDDMPALLAKFLDAPEDSIAAEMEHVHVLSADELTKDIKDGTADKWLTSLNDMFVRFDKTSKKADPSTYFLSEEYINA